MQHSNIVLENGPELRIPAPLRCGEGKGHPEQSGRRWLRAHENDKRHLSICIDPSDFIYYNLYLFGYLDLHLVLHLLAYLSIVVQTSGLPLFDRTLRRHSYR